MPKHRELFEQLHLDTVEKFDEQIVRSIPDKTRKFLQACFEGNVFDIKHEDTNWERELALFLLYLFSQDKPRDLAQQNQITLHQMSKSMPAILQQLLADAKQLHPDFQVRFPDQKLSLAPKKVRKKILPLLPDKVTDRAEKKPRSPGRKRNFSAEVLEKLTAEPSQDLDSTALEAEYQETQTALDSLQPGAYMTLTRKQPIGLITFGNLLKKVGIRKWPQDFYGTMMEILASEWLIANRKLGDYYVIAAKDLDRAFNLIANDPRFR